MIETLGDLGDFIGGIAVVITIYYLAIQIRQNTAATSAASMVGIIGSSRDQAAAVAAPQLPMVLARLNAGERLEREELVIFRFHAQGMLANQWQVFYLNQRGLVETPMMAAWDRRNSVFFEMPLFRAAWRDLRVGYPEDFQQHMDDLFSALPSSGSQPATPSH